MERFVTIIEVYQLVYFRCRSNNSWFCGQPPTELATRKRKKKQPTTKRGQTGDSSYLEASLLPSESGLYGALALWTAQC